MRAASKRSSDWPILMRVRIGLSYRSPRTAMVPVRTLNFSATWDQTSSVTRRKSTRRTGMSKFHEAANLYIALGWKVFPLAAATKVPAISKREGGQGFKDATDDPAIIAD